MRNEQEGAERALARLEADLVAARRPGTPAAAWMLLDGLLLKLRVDLEEHTRVEQNELFPAALELEQRLVARRLAGARPPSSRR